MERFSNLVLSRTFRRISGGFLRRNIMTTQARAEKALDELKTNAYYEKYAEKIAKLQQTSPEEFLSRVEVFEKKKTPKKVEPKKADDLGKFSQLLNPKKPLEYAEGCHEQSLDKVMKVDLIRDKTAEEIADIWRTYHRNKNFVSATIPSTDYDEFIANTKLYPTFVFPLPRPQGYEFFLIQFESNSVHITPLLYYQVHKENAPECLTITHYTELAETKKVVLMRGEYDTKVINLTEAQCLANQLKLYYIRPSPHKRALLEAFTKTPDDFKHMDLVEQIESLSL